MRVKSPSSLLAWRRQSNESVVVVTGSFDIFQPGNLEVLRQASLLAKRIVVVVEPDDVVAAHSSPGRPQNKLETRVEMVSYLRHVQAVTSFPVAEANAFFAGLKPFIWVTAKTQTASEAYAKALFVSAERVVEVASQRGCFTEDIILAMAENRTPVKLPPAWGAEALESSVTPVSVTVNGCFDILHIGHLRFLAEARALGDRLTVLINSDASVARYKGATRPVFPETFRAEALKALRCVDDVLVFAGDNPLDEIRQLRPLIHVKGGSYEPERVRAERELVESWGGRLVCTAMVEGFSTTDFIRKALGAKATILI
ncbi:MAG: adenylyltransferase/cytidyltransferase family protein [bacterium]